MREIKFRAWLKDNWGVQGDKMVDVLYTFPLCNNPERVYDLKKTKYKNDEFDITLLQYTGLKDKNGVEIYEGDLIKGHNLPIGDNPAEVCWSQNSLSYQVDGKFCGCELSKLDAKSIVVVGNVYE